MNLTLVRKPSAWLPIALSVAASALVLGYLMIGGNGQQSDEGALAHVWQILMVVQLPVIAYFAFKWLPTTPKPAWAVISLQVASAVAAILIVLLLGL
jgi:hypothetical protein